MLTLRNLTSYCKYANKVVSIRPFSNSPVSYCINAKKVESPSEEVATPTVETLLEEVNKLTEQNNEINTKLTDLDSKYKRALADRENVRNRLQKQITEAKQYGIQGFCKDLLEVTDVFEKAIESVKQEDLETNNGLKNLYDGLVMTESTLLGVFRRHKLQKLEIEIGEKFNPAEQEAMFEVPAGDGLVPGTIAHKLRAGWKLHDRCIRSAQVGVVKN